MRKISFQFHKVRLKVQVNHYRQLPTKFQFHKVRLKDRKAGIGLQIPKFQFHKVRLKEVTQTKEPISDGGFNSIRYD